jgi:hypothetical protein
MSEHTLERSAAEPLTFETFIAGLQEPGACAPVISPRLYVAALQLDLQTLAEQAKVHRNTVSRSPGTEAVQRFLRDAVRVIKAAADLSCDLNKALFWYRNHPLQPFRYKTAEQVVADVKADAVVRYISMLEAGAAG